MANSYRTRFANSPIMGGMTPAVKWLLIVNTAVFVASLLLARSANDFLLPWFGLVPSQVVHSLAIWQPVTYLFLHSTSGFGHILMNMLTLWMFGVPLEGVMGTRRFVRYYFFCGIGAGISVIVLNYAFGYQNTRTIGASGAIYGLLLAFGLIFPTARILFFFLFPIQARIYVWIMGAIVFLSTLTDSGGGVSNVAHLGGMLFGYLFLRAGLDRVDLPEFHPIDDLRRSYREWKLARAKRKFQVYLKKRGPGPRDPWVH